MPTVHPVEALMPFPEPEIANVKVNGTIQSLWGASKRFQILSGPPGTGKTRAAQDFSMFCHAALGSTVAFDECRISSLFPTFRTEFISDEAIRVKIRSLGLRFLWDIAVLHPQYAYEDLIRGYRAEPISDHAVSLVVREGLLGFMSRVGDVLAAETPSAKHPTVVLILDEINRAPIGQLFGEALFALDRRGCSVTTSYPLENVGPAFAIPENLLVLGTMNSIDRATAGFDFALRRRFANVPLLSDKKPVLAFWERFPAEQRIGIKLYDLVEKIINADSTEATGSIPKSELLLGHAYYLPPSGSDASTAIQWMYVSYAFQILPTLAEYVEQGLLQFKPEALNSLPLCKDLDYAVACALGLDEGCKQLLSNLQ